MQLTLIIATCGRPDRLVHGLESVRAAVAAWGGEAAVIVVDNHPDYAAAGAAAGFAARSGLSCAFLRSEPFNKARALNAGIDAARTDWLAFTDDDTLPEAGWLKEGMRFAVNGGFRVFGGRVTAGAAEKPLPRWLRPGRSGRVPSIGVFVAYDPIPATGPLPLDAAAPFGANLFVRREVFREHGGYDEPLWALCRRMWPLGSEDSEFGHRLKLRGERIGYCRESVVLHPANLERATIRVHLERAFCDGWRQPLIFTEERRRWLEPFRVRVALSHAAGALADSIRLDSAGAMYHGVRGMRAAGAIAGRWSRAYRRRVAGRAAA